MSFDVDAFRAAHRPWSFNVTVGGRLRTFAARHVSAPTVLRYEEKLDQAGIDQKALAKAIFWLLRHAFPWRPSYLLYGDPVLILLRLEPAARGEALRDFFVCLRGRPHLSPPPLTKTPQSPHSSRPIRTRSA